MRCCWFCIANKNHSFINQEKLGIGAYVVKFG